MRQHFSLIVTYYIEPLVIYFIRVGQHTKDKMRTQSPRNIYLRKHSYYYKSKCSCSSHKTIILLGGFGLLHVR